jgi:hypothetical protein
MFRKSKASESYNITENGVTLQVNEASSPFFSMEEDTSDPIIN